MKKLKRSDRRNSVGGSGRIGIEHVLKKLEEYDKPFWLEIVIRFQFHGHPSSENARLASEI